MNTPDLSRLRAELERAAMMIILTHPDGPLLVDQSIARAKDLGIKYEKLPAPKSEDWITPKVKKSAIQAH